MIYFVAILELIVLLVALRALAEYLERSSKLSQHMSTMQQQIIAVERKHKDHVEHSRQLAREVAHIESEHLGLREIFKSGLGDNS